MHKVELVNTWDNSVLRLELDNNQVRLLEYFFDRGIIDNENYNYNILPEDIKYEKV